MTHVEFFPFFASMQVVVICGRNQKLVQKLEATTWSSNMNVIVNGFVDNMHQWMGASDCIITKAGPGTIAESLICGLPMLLNGFVPGQVREMHPDLGDAAKG